MRVCECMSVCACIHPYLWSETVFVRVAGNGRHAINAEIKRRCGKPGALKEGHDEAAETAVD